MSRHALEAAIAAHRFGLGEADLAVVGNDPRGWLLAQTGAAPAARGADEAPGSTEALRRIVRYQQQQRQMRVVGAADAAGAAGAAGAAEPADDIRALVQADQRARLGTAVLSTRPFGERLVLFWANHFTVSMAKGSVRGLVGAFEREAIRPHLGGRFADMLQAAAVHPAMLRYLDNDNSAGPDSPLVQRARRQRREGDEAPRISGLNENLAREILELHTLGAAGGGAAWGGWGGYSQADVTMLARVLTGWRMPLRALAAGESGSATRFEPAWHQPGPKTVLNRRYAEGPDALPAVLADLARQPATARFIASKLARHFVADEPPAALVARLARTFESSDGDLPTLHRALVDAPEAWQAQPAKLKTPEEFVVGSLRLLRAGEAALARTPADGGTAQLGQRMQAAPSPAGWPDRADEWLGPDAVWKRVEWATRLAERAGRGTDARVLAQASLGPLLQADTLRQIERAADGQQALALLLLAPELQRR